MVGKDEGDSTNLSLSKVGRSGRIAVAGEDDVKNKDAAAFKHLMAKMQEEARPVGYIFGRGALDHDDLLYLKEQNQAEEDANRQRELNERRAFAAFKAAVTAADSAPASISSGPNVLPAASSPRVVVQSRPRSGIRQNALLLNIVAVKPKAPKKDLPRSRSGDTLTKSRSGDSEAQPRSGDFVTQPRPGDSEAQPKRPRTSERGDAEAAGRACDGTPPTCDEISKEREKDAKLSSMQRGGKDFDQKQDKNNKGGSHGESPHVCEKERRKSASTTLLGLEYVDSDED